MRRIPLVSGLFLALLTACTAGPGGGADAGEVPVVDAGEDPIPPDTLADAFAGALCAYVVRCAPDRFPGGLAECLRFAATLPAQDLSSPAALEASVTSGEVTFDSAGAATCFQNLREADCGAFERLATLPGCGPALAGKRVEDESCRSDWACVAGLRCALPNAQACEGKCVPWLGAPCGSNAECEPEGYCRPVDQNGGECAALKQDGETCAQGEPCAAGLACSGPAGNRTCEPLANADESCLSTQCADGLYCADLRAAPSCIPLPEAGESCALLRACAPGSTCINDSCEPPGVEGASCGVGLPACGSGLLCVTGECRLLPTEPDGPCLSNQCGPGFYCDTVASTCQPLPSSGPCFNGRCDTSAWCDGGVCRSLSAVGGRCVNAGSCEAGLRCVGSGTNRTCQVLAASGESCTSIADCVSGLDCLGAGAARTCNTPVTEGSSCENSGQCGSLARCYQAPRTEADQRCRATPLGEELDPCDDDSQCVAGLRCLASVCATPGEEGEGCPVAYSRRGCVDGLICAPDQPSGNQCAPPAGEGEPCPIVGQCGHPAAGLFCGVDFKCRGLPGPGEKCVESRGVQLCDPLRAFCQADASGFTCVAFPAPGTRCQGDIQCPPDRACLLKEGGEFKTCEPLVIPVCGGD